MVIHLLTKQCFPIPLGLGFIPVGQKGRRRLRVSIKRLDTDDVPASISAAATRLNKGGFEQKRLSEHKWLGAIRIAHFHATKQTP